MRRAAAPPWPRNLSRAGRDRAQPVLSRDGRRRAYLVLPVVTRPPPQGEAAQLERVPSRARGVSHEQTEPAARRSARVEAQRRLPPRHLPHGHALGRVARVDPEGATGAPPRAGELEHAHPCPRAEIAHVQPRSRTRARWVGSRGGGGVVRPANGKLELRSGARRERREPRLVLWAAGRRRARSGCMEVRAGGGSAACRGSPRGDRVESCAPPAAALLPPACVTHAADRDRRRVGAVGLRAVPRATGSVPAPALLERELGVLPVRRNDRHRQALLHAVAAESPRVALAPMAAAATPLASLAPPDELAAAVADRFHTPRDACPARLVSRAALFARASCRLTRAAISRG